MCVAGKGRESYLLFGVYILGDLATAKDKLTSRWPTYWELHREREVNN